LTDNDGVAFNGAQPDPGYSGQVPPPTEPPLSIFESATISFPYYATTNSGSLSVLTQNLTALPEPGVTALLLAPLAALVVRKKRAPEA
jgi:hypothetical protein